MASNLIRVGDLDINQDMSFQRRLWTLQRIGWILLGLAVLGASLGVFGGGPVSHTTIGGPALPFLIEYERLGRYHSPQTLRVRVKSDPPKVEPLTLWLSDDYATRVEIKSILPRPLEVSRSADGFSYHFRLDPSSGGDIILRLEAQAVGHLSGLIGLDPSRTIPISQWIYP